MKNTCSGHIWKTGGFYCYIYLYVFCHFIISMLTHLCLSIKVCLIGSLPLYVSHLIPWLRKVNLDIFAWPFSVHSFKSTLSKFLLTIIWLNYLQCWSLNQRITEFTGLLFVCPFMFVLCKDPKAVFESTI